ncbi:MAG: 2-iminoacetate synthase ThiH [Deltaproteobacteria bacterium]|nr:2-iminoacetate synthase ThiH [Deltaproteobacteria bacterium]
MNSSLEDFAQRAHMLTVQRFGKTIKLFAPLYISNECVNDCAYCGFKRDNPIVRKTLTVDEVVKEAELLIASGHQHILIVAGEHPKAVNLPFLVAIAQRLRPQLSQLSLEVQPFDEPTYRTLHEAGYDGVVIYQETYDRDVYRQMHHYGPKASFDNRIASIDAAGRAGMRHLGLGVLLGLADWKKDVAALLEHARGVIQRHWQSTVSISFPRITPAVDGFMPTHPVSDQELAEIICTTRLALPDADLVLSTREPPALRAGLMKLGITRMSAGSRTDPGGYMKPGMAGEQFHLEDQRSSQEVAHAIANAGYQPVWKDWDHHLL